MVSRRPSGFSENTSTFKEGDPETSPTREEDLQEGQDRVPREEVPFKAQTSKGSGLIPLSSQKRRTPANVGERPRKNTVNREQGYLSH